MDNIERYMNRPPLHRYNTERKLRNLAMLAAYRGGKSYAEVAEEFGMSRDCARKILQKLKKVL